MTKLTISYKNTAGKLDSQAMEVKCTRLTLLGRTEGLPASVLAQIALVEGVNYGIAIEAENDVTEMEEKEDGWSKKEGERS